MLSPKKISHKHTTVKKGRVLFIVSVLPSKNKPDRLRNKKSICLHVLTVFDITQPPENNLFVMNEKKQDSALTHNILYTLTQAKQFSDKEYEHSK